MSETSVDNAMEGQKATSLVLHTSSELDQMQSQIESFCQNILTNCYLRYIKGNSKGTDQLR